MDVRDELAALSAPTDDLQDLYYKAVLLIDTLRRTVAEQGSQLHEVTADWERAGESLKDYMDMCEDYSSKLDAANSAAIEMKNALDKALADGVAQNEYATSLLSKLNRYREALEYIVGSSEDGDDTQAKGMAHIAREALND